MANLYSSLPCKSYSIREFILLAKSVENDDNSAFLRLLLTGEADDHQVVVDPIRNSLSPEHPISVTRDYDSVVAITNEIVVASSISVYPVPNPAEVLTSNVHIDRFVRIGNSQSARRVPLHRIPGFQIAYWGQRHMIHIFFPSLATEDRISQQLTKTEKTQFYELGLRPSVAALLPHDVSDWPPTYSSEMFRARKQSGHVAYGTKVLPAWILPALAATLRAKLAVNNVEWTEHFFFTHTIRGTKHGTQHSINRAAADRALTEYLTDAKIPLAAVQEGEWWVDVGVEFRSERDVCLQWRTSSHFHIVKDVLAITENHADRITSLGSSKYERDIVSHLPAVSGCRIEPGVQAQGPYEAAYFQMYTTDKAVTYNPERGHHGKAITLGMAMGKVQPPAFIEDLIKAYIDAADKISSNARVEVRVPFEHATTVLLGFNDDVIRESLLSFTPSEWWTFRAYRAIACSRTFLMQAAGNPALRIKPDALLLTAACAWLVNGLHARPDDGPASRSLMQAVLPLIDADDADDDTLAFAPRNHRHAAEEEEEEGDNDEPPVPHHPFGLIFLRRVMVDINVPRMRAGGPFLTPPAFKYIFGTPIDEMKYKYFTTGIVPREVLQRTRIVTNKTKRTPTHVGPSGVDEPEPPLFDLAAQGYELPPPAADSGSDVEDGLREHDTQSSGNIDEEVSTMWRQFLTDVAIKTPNRAGATNASYFKLSRDQRLSASEDVYKNCKLSDMWSACQYMVGSQEDWDRAFGHLFPEREHKTAPNVQNYMQCKYYLQWKEICATATPTTVDAIRRQLRRKISSLEWIPHASQDKLWPTAQLGRFTRLPPESRGPAPRLLVKGVPEWE